MAEMLKMTADLMPDRETAARLACAALRHRPECLP
jgi:hypothetical protein